MIYPTPLQMLHAIKRYPHNYLLFLHSLVDSNKFWSRIWAVCGGALFLCALLNAGLFFVYTRPSGQSSAVGVFDPSLDPFSNKLRGETFVVVSNELYKDSLPTNFNPWSWQARADWRSSAARHEGPYALEVAFEGEGGTLGVSSPPIGLAEYQSISLWVRPSEAIGDLYLSLYNAKGISLGKQSISWYAPESRLTPNVWQMVNIPLANLVSGGSATISGYSLSADYAGTAFFDSLQLEKGGVEHAAWVQPSGSEAPKQPVNFAPAQLPYELSSTPEALHAWQNYYGLFLPQGTGLAVGPLPQGDSSGSTAALLSGRGWGDYKVSIALNWGDTSEFSLLVRFVDEKNYVACSFSDAGVGVKMYSVVGGKSKLIEEKQRLAGSDTISVRVVGDTVSCLDDDNSRALTQTISSMAPQGTVGIETWSNTPNASPHTIKSFRVTPVASE